MPPPPIPYADADTNEMTLNDIIRSLRYRKMLFDTGDTVRPTGADAPPVIPKIQKDPSGGFESLGNSFREHLNTPPADVGPGGGFEGLGNSFREHLTPPAGGTGDRGILDWANDNKWPLMGGAAAAALLGGGAYAYHRNRKKKKNAYGEEEKEAQYKPYTSYTPPIISPYHMIKKSDDSPISPLSPQYYKKPKGFQSLPGGPTIDPYNYKARQDYFIDPSGAAKSLPLPLRPPFFDKENVTPQDLMDYDLLKKLEKAPKVPLDKLELKPKSQDVIESHHGAFGNIGTHLGDISKSMESIPKTPIQPAAPVAPAAPAAPAAPEDPGAIDEDFLAQEGGPNYLKTQDPPTPATPAAPPTPVKTQDPSWFEQNKWPLLGGLAAAGLLGGGAYAYHRSKQKENKKDSTEDDDEEKEAQYKPYTSYTPPIISPYKFFNYYG